MSALVLLVIEGINKDDRKIKNDKNWTLYLSVLTNWPFTHKKEENFNSPCVSKFRLKIKSTLSAPNWRWSNRTTFRYTVTGVTPLTKKVSRSTSGNPSKVTSQVMTSLSVTGKNTDRYIFPSNRGSWMCHVCRPRLPGPVRDPREKRKTNNRGKLPVI